MTGVTNINDGSPNMIPILTPTSRPQIMYSVGRLITSARTRLECVPSTNVINVNIPQLRDLINNRRHSPVLYHDHNVAPDHSTLEWVLSSGGMHSEVGIAIHSSSHGALEAMHTRLSGYHKPIEYLFSRAPQALARGAHCLVSESEDPPHSSMLWTTANIFTYVSAPLTLQQVSTYVLRWH